MVFKKQRNAVVLYGFLRTWKTVAHSLIKNVLEKNDADLFVFAPDINGIQVNYHKSSNNDALCGEHISESELKQVYGHYLKSYKLVKYDERNIVNNIDLSSAVVIGDINPTRQLSLFYHIRQSLLLLEKYEQEHNVKYDNIILTRGDIAFYSFLNLKEIENLDAINIIKGEGIERNRGERRYGLATVFYYKNVKDAICIPGNTYNFSDLVIASKRDNIMKLKEIYTNFQEIVDKQVPCNAETMCFYWLNILNCLEVLPSLNILCEIFRPHFKEIENVNDLEGYLEDRTLSKEHARIYRNLSFYKIFFLLKYMFNKKKRREKKELIRILRYRKNRRF